MSLFAEVYVSHPEFVLMDALDACPDVTVEPRYRSSLGPEEATLVFDAFGDDLAAFDSALDGDPTVVDFTVVAESDGHRVYNARHGEVQTVSPKVGAVGGSVRLARCYAGGRCLRLELPNSEALRALGQACEDDGIDFRTERLYRLEESDGNNVYGLTAKQRETLELAHERGYFADPRETSLDELATELDVSPTALSRRLRRATDRLVANTLRE